MTERTEPATPPVDEVFRQTAELLRTTRGPLLRASVSVGDTRIDLEWPEPRDEPGAPDRVAPEAETEADDAALVRAPMVGTFYHAPEPGAPAFVRPGDRVEPGRQVGVLEAMKLMNPIHADVSGTVAEVLVADGKPVEYGEPLITVTPDRS